ncbi:MAG: carboxypeptidase-like regulatory domain-containing protein [Saprospiraceae bacterium]|nr:carboxypeptidase-like regulatory domain-containing protein [Saprospiraceae bacterium]
MALLLHLFCVDQGYGQFLIEGQVLSLPNEKPIAFANIGVMNSSLGTISEFDGSFSFHIGSAHVHDTVIFSALGYASVSVPVQDMVSNPKINVYLKEETYTLSEIVVCEDRIKPRQYVAGNGKYQGGSLYADTVNAGSAMALLITNRSLRGKTRFDYPSYVPEAQVLIINNTFDQFRLRARIMDVDISTGQPMPGEDLLNESVVVQSSIYRDWLTVDLSPYRIRVEQDFFLVFEWILEKKDRQILHQQYASFKRKYPGKLSTQYSKVNGKSVSFENYQGNFYFGTSFGITLDGSLIKAHTCYYRLNSLGRWYRAPSVLAARVTLSNQVDNKALVPESKRTIPSDVNQLLSHYRTYFEPPDEESLPTGNKKHCTRFDKLKYDPVEIRVLRDQNNLHFDAISQSIYPYELTLSFSTLHNLTPIVPMKKFVVGKGRNRMLTLSVVFKDLDNYHYELAVQRRMGDPSWEPKLQYTYRVPVQAYKPLNIAPTASDTTVAYSDRFFLGANDTLFAMRNGTITHASGTAKQLNQIDSTSIVEVLHNDGTVMIYGGNQISAATLEVGKEVLVGEVLGVCEAQGELEVSLYLLKPDALLREVSIYYYIDSTKSLQYIDLQKDVVIRYPKKVLN